MHVRWAGAFVLTGAVATGAYVASRPTVYRFEHMDVVGQDTDPVIRHPLDLSCPSGSAFFVLEKDGRLLKFEKGTPYRGTQIAQIENSVAIAYDDMTDAVLVLAESGHTVFQVKNGDNEVERLFRLDQHYPLGGVRGFVAGLDGHILLNNSAISDLAPILGIATNGQIEHQLGTRSLDPDPLVEISINAARLRFAPYLLALNVNTGVLTSFIREPPLSVQLPLPRYSKRPKSEGDSVDATPVFMDVAPILNEQILVLGSGRSYVLGLVLDQLLNVTGQVKLSKKTPDWVASQHYTSVCQLTYNKYALLSPARLDIYQLLLQ